jgi:methylated-DNA-[protein]-cysteine S-methyltransferase
MRPGYPVCRAIEPDLVAVAVHEAGAAAAERVAEHVRGCRSCREELEEYRAVDRLVGSIRASRLTGDDATLARAELESRLADLRSRILRFGVHASPLGPILLARSELGVSLVRYLEGDAPLAAQVRRWVGDDAVEDRMATEGLHRDLLDYLEGRRSRLDWPLDLRRARSDFQRRVLGATLALPYGGVTSYAGIAREIGAPEAVRPVAQALRHNPLPIAIPCHRVIGNSGALVGYAGRRVSLKQRLLAIEGVPTVAPRGGLRVPRERMYVRYLHETEYCVPSCGSLAERPLAELTLFGSRARAEAAGLGPCTSCRPDLHPLAEDS